jgi:hypothetical protein
MPGWSADQYELSDMFRHVDGLAWAGSFDQIDQYFDSIDVATSSTLLLIGCLRFTYTYRDRLSSWPDLLERTKNEFVIRDCVEDLHGLF